MRFINCVAICKPRALVSLIPVGGYILYQGMTERYWVAAEILTRKPVKSMNTSDTNGLVITTANKSFKIMTLQH